MHFPQRTRDLEILQVPTLLEKQALVVIVIFCLDLKQVSSEVKHEQKFIEINHRLWLKYHMLCYTTHAVMKMSKEVNVGEGTWDEASITSGQEGIILSALMRLRYRAVGANWSECICSTCKQPVAVDE